MPENLPADVNKGHFKQRNRARAVFATPDEMLANGLEYVQWCKDTPLSIQKTAVFEGKPQYYKELAERIPSLTGWAAYVGVTDNTVAKWLIHKDAVFREAAQSVRTAIRNVQIEGGAVGSFHATIASRLAGLEEPSQLITAQTQIADESDVTKAPTYHPDDVDCLGPLYTPEQLERGAVWTPPSYAK